MGVEKRKVGQFFLFIGLILLVIFFATDQARHPSYGYFIGGFACVFLGGFMMFRYRKPAEPNTARFRTVRKWQEQSRQRREEKRKRRG